MWGASSTSSPTVLRGAQIKLTRRLFDGVASRLTNLFPHSDDGSPPHAQGHARLGRPLARRGALLAGMCADASATTTAPRDRGIFISILARPPHLRSIVSDAVPRREPLDLGDRSKLKIIALIPSSRARTPPGGARSAPSRRRAAARRASYEERPSVEVEREPPRTSPAPTSRTVFLVAAVLVRAAVAEATRSASAAAPFFWERGPAPRAARRPRRPAV